MFVCVLTVGIGVSLHFLNKHRRRQVCIFRKSSDLKSDLEESHGVGMYGLSFCKCDVGVCECNVGVCVFVLLVDKNKTERVGSAAAAAASRGQRGVGNTLCTDVVYWVDLIAVGKGEHTYLVLVWFLLVNLEWVPCIFITLAVFNHQEQPN